MIQKHESLHNPDHVHILTEDPVSHTVDKGKEKGGFAGNAVHEMQDGENMKSERP